jgi:hypothetical protein
MNIFKAIYNAVFDTKTVPAAKVIQKDGMWSAHNKKASGDWAPITGKPHCTQGGAMCEARDLGYKVVP